MAFYMEKRKDLKQQFADKICLISYYNILNNTIIHG